MNEMRKLMEMVQMNEYKRMEPIYTEYRDPDGDFVVKYRASRGYYVDGAAADRAPSFENLDDAIEHGELSMLSLDDGIDEDSSDDNIDPKTGDIQTYDRNDAEFMQDIISLTDEADEALAGDDNNPAEQLNQLAQIMQDISNITRLRASGRPYAPIHGT